MVPQSAEDLVADFKICDPAPDPNNLAGGVPSGDHGWSLPNTEITSLLLRTMVSRSLKELEDNK